MADPKEFQHQVVTGQDELVAVLKDLMERFQRGELTCAALRLYKADGTFEDMVVGGESEEERARALAALQSQQHLH